MKKIVLVIVLVILVSAGAGGLLLRNELSKFEVTQITPDLHMISGDFGGNVAVLKTGEGAVVVDTMTFTMQGKIIRKMAEEMTGEPVVAVINSHYHLDHSHGNPAFDSDTRFIATERSLHHMQQLAAGHFSGDAAESLPNETFRLEHEISVGDKTMVLIHPGRGHTDGDLVVLFVEDRVLHAGDLFFNKHYPNIDLEAGGSIIEWDHTLERLFDLPFEKIIPGHGSITNADGMRQFQAFIRELAEVGRYAHSINGSLDDTIVNGQLTADKDYAPITFGPLMSLDRSFVMQRAWEEATGNFELYPGY